MQLEKNINFITAEHIKKARLIMDKVVDQTPLQYDEYLSKKYDCHVLLKREDKQKVRSFKIRGAFYAINCLKPDILDKGVVCASAGNHAQGVALTCNYLKKKAVIFMPITTPKQKISQVKFFGEDYVDIQLIGDNFDTAAAAAIEYANNNDQAFIPPFDDENVIIGQGTVALEIFEQLKTFDLSADYIFASIGGGGLISGVASYTKSISPITKVIGVEPKGAASMKSAIIHGSPIELSQIDTFVDGAAVKKVGNLTYLYAKKYVDDFITVDEGLDCVTILDLYTKQAIVAEPAGALTVASLEVYKDNIKGKTVVCIISGGNNDIKRTPEIEERALVYTGLKHYFVVNFPQRPGALKEFVVNVLGSNDDIVHFEYSKKTNRSVGPVIIGIQLNEPNDYNALTLRLKEFDPKYINLIENQSLYSLLI